MRYRNVLLFCISVLLHAGQVTAQEKAKTEIASVVQTNASTIAVAVTSSRDFIVGNNKYVLHIGDQLFDRYSQGIDENGRMITFMVPAKEFNSLKEHAKVYLVYGEVDEEQIEALCKDPNFPCWDLGTFSRSSLKK